MMTKEHVMATIFGQGPDSHWIPAKGLTRHKWSYGRNSLKRQRLWGIVFGQWWLVIRTEIGKFGSYADPSKHCSADHRRRAMC